MASPVVIDDGGSTRIRQLMDQNGINGLTAPPFIGTVDDPFILRHGVLCRLTIRYFEDSGAHQGPFPAGGQPVQPGDTIDIDFGGGQQAHITFDAAFHMVIDLTAGLVPPDVAPAPDNLGNLRYIVKNANAIQTVQYNGGVIFDATGRSSIFTFVHFKP